MRSASRGAIQREKGFGGVLVQKKFLRLGFGCKSFAKKMLPREMDQGLEEVGNGREESRARVPWQAKSSATPDPKSSGAEIICQSFSCLKKIWDGFLGPGYRNRNSRHLTFPVVISSSSSPRAIL